MGLTAFKSQNISETGRNILSIWSNIKKELEILELSEKPS